MQIIELEHGYNLIPEGNKVIALKSDPTDIVSWGEYSFPKSLDPNDFIEVARPENND